MWIFYCVVWISNILESVKSIINSPCSSRIPNIKAINNIADYNFYISMARLKAKLPTPGAFDSQFFPSSRAFVHKNFVDPLDAWGGMVRVRIERDITRSSMPPDPWEVSTVSTLSNGIGMMAEKAKLHNKKIKWKMEKIEKPHCDNILKISQIKTVLRIFRQSWWITMMSELVPSLCDAILA